MARPTLAFTVVTLLSLVNIGTGVVIVGTKPKWALRNSSPGCGTDFISSGADCLAAAQHFGFTGRLTENLWSNKPPGCSADTYNIYFNQNTVGTTGIASLTSICLYPGSAVIPEAYALTVPACKEEDNVLYWGNDFNYPNNTKDFPNGTVADCANWCGEVGECKFWTFVKSTKKCYLKDNHGTDDRINNDRVSGSKECAAPIPNCGTEEHSIACCPDFSIGDNAEGREEFLQEHLVTKTCSESCKEHYPSSVGITESKVQTYPNSGKPKCWCEFGVAKLNQNGIYQTCMFNKE